MGGKLTLKYDLPPEKDAGRQDGEVVETSEKHKISNTNPEVVMKILKSLLAHNDVDITFKVKKLD
ncbi:hypothetical protein LMB49_03840 [Limosilactobacillus reuteri]|uniref:hypothetical protein n=1 Tax=Limosilactobacillus reuteri TaxID=1598 RepID=UPI001E2DD9A3|nr:hypothetical protein [Limosilactobacillus reuteri]MCC4370529.1 hypothetical protein [Limosilactobacillus reuteri]MCC4509416.1 hypothetical protein [Limosilactobacillus reuteri]